MGMNEKGYLYQLNFNYKDEDLKYLDTLEKCLILGYKIQEL